MARIVVSTDLPPGRPRVLYEERVEPRQMDSSDFAAVAVASRDLIAEIDTRAGRLVRKVSVGRPQGLGTQPVSLTVSPRGDTLYSADSGEDAVGVIALAARGRPRPHRVVRVHSASSIARYFRVIRHVRSRARRARLRHRYVTGRFIRACAGVLSAGGDPDDPK